MTDAEDSGTQEAAEGSESADLTEESPERRYSNTSISEETAYESGKASDKIAAKKTGRRSSLEKAVSESDAGDYRAESQNTKLSLNLAKYVEAAHSSNSDEDKEGPNSAVIIIYHRNKQTDSGELEFLFEQKPLDHPDASGKLSLVGGRIQKGEKSLEALVRELTEEIEEPAASIIIESLGTNPRVYKKLPYEYKGIKGYSDIYVIEIMQESRWNDVKHAVFKHDAGTPRVLKHNEIHIDDFAFGYGEIVKKFADDKFGTKKSAHLPYAGSAYLAQFSSKKFSPFPYAGSSYSAPSLLSLDSSKHPLAGLQIAA